MPNLPMALYQMLLVSCLLSFCIVMMSLRNANVEIFLTVDTASAVLEALISLNAGCYMYSSCNFLNTTTEM